MKKQINKKTPLGKGIRTTYQALIPAIPFLLGLLSLDEVQQAITTGEVAIGAVIYAGVVFALTYIQNSLGK